MKGRKGSTDEGGVRAPFLIRWPGQIAAGARLPQIAGAIDLLPTLADMAGIPIVSRKPLDGISLKALLLGSAKDWPDRMIFSHWNSKVSVRTQKYRLDTDGKLYDMVKDPGQKRDINKEEPETAARLNAAVAQWNSHGSEVAIAHYAHKRIGIVTRQVRFPLDADTPTAVAAERKRIRQPG